MSYILEALRRAERERNPVQGETPRIESRTRLAQIPDLQQLRQYRPVMVAGLCVCLIAAVTVLLIKRPHDAVALDTTSTTPAAPAPAAIPTAAPDPYGSLLKQVYGDGNGPATLDDLVDAGVEPNSNDEFSTYNDPDSSTRSSEAAMPANDDATGTAAPPIPAPAAAPLPAPAPAPAPTRPAPVTSVERLQLDPAPAPQTPRLSDMPSDYRAAFPALSLDVHSYDSSPKKRFIMIAGHRYNEGDVLPEGPRIVQIVPEGVVFDFRSEQVLFGIAH